MSQGKRIRCGMVVFVGFSNCTPELFGTMENPGRLLNAPENTGVPRSRLLNVLMLKPSRTSQNAFGKLPLLPEAITSVTSSLPKVLLSTQNDRIPRGNGLSRLPPVMVEVPGKAVSSSCLKNG